MAVNGEVYSDDVGKMSLSNGVKKIGSSTMPIDVTSFMQSPLVEWVKTFNTGNEPLMFPDLAEGVYLNDVMFQIDPRPSGRTVHRCVQSINARIQNFDILLQAIKSFYEDVLEQTIVMQLPNVVTICKSIETATGLKELEKLLLLLLGCAVQCDRKEEMVENIKNLDFNVQHAIVSYIQQITDNYEAMLSQEWRDLSELPEDQQALMYKCLYEHCKRLVCERDVLQQNLVELVLGSEKPAIKENGITGQGTAESHHLAVELADSKAKLRRLRQELEEKNEQVLELREELELITASASKLKQENAELLQDARTARSYRDELDVVRERANVVGKLENELLKCREKLGELDFFKARVEELREDNHILLETKHMLEDQLASSHKRTETIIDLENDLMKCKAQISELEEERDVDRERIDELVTENTQLMFDKQNSINESANLGVQLQEARKSSTGNSLSEQLNESASATILRLQLENQKLQHTLEEARESAAAESSKRISELEKENHRLSEKLNSVQETSNKESQNFFQLEHQHQDLQKQKEDLNKTLETVKENAERQRTEFESEVKQLSDTVEKLRRRNQKNADARLKDIQKENQVLHENVKDLSSRLSNVEFEKKQLLKQNLELKDGASRADELEKEVEKLDNRNLDLQKTVSTLQLTCDKFDKLEKEHLALEADNRKLSKTVSSSKGMCEKIEKLEKENVTLNVENQKLSRTLENMKEANREIVNLETDKELLNQENQKLKALMESSTVDRAQIEQLEIKLIDLENENLKLQKMMEASSRKVEEVENENNELGDENQKLLKELETLKLQTRKLEEVEKYNCVLEDENSILEKQAKSLEKETVRLKNALEVKESTIDELSAKTVELERDLKKNAKQLEKNNDAVTRLKEIEKENKDLIQQLSLDKKTLATLREDLVNEKIKSQQLSNELEKLNSELERIGVDKEKLVAAEHMQDENRYKALENMMEDALKKSLEIKQEKINALEKRLEEYNSRNQKLQENISQLRCQHETLQQRQAAEKPIERAPESMAPARADNTEATKMAANLTAEIVQLKDNLADVKKNNAVLVEEKTNLAQKITVMEEQTKALPQLQSNMATLQVENTTLQSQLSSLQSQHEALQQQNSQLESEKEKLLHQLEELKGTHGTLLADNATLQQLHTQLTNEHELLVNQHGTFKTAHKQLKSDFKELKKKYEELVKEKAEIDSIRTTLSNERETLKSDYKSMSSLHLDYNNLRESNTALQHGYDKVKTDYNDLLAEYKNLKSENNSMKLRHTEIQGDLAECRDHANALDVDLAKTTNRCEMLQQMNATLEEENKTLMNHISALLAQNQDLLFQTLESKDQFYEEQRAFADKVNDLKKQKEKLEEKIIDQYKKMAQDAPMHKKKKLGGIVRKAKGFISRHQNDNLVISAPLTHRKETTLAVRGSRKESFEESDGIDTSSLSSADVVASSHVERSVDDGTAVEVAAPVIRRSHGQQGHEQKHSRKSLPPEQTESTKTLQHVKESFSSSDIPSDNWKSYKTRSREAVNVLGTSDAASNRISYYDNVPLEEMPGRRPSQKTDSNEPASTVVMRHSNRTSEPKSSRLSGASLKHIAEEPGMIVRTSTPKVSHATPHTTGYESDTMFNRPHSRSSSNVNNPRRESQTGDVRSLDRRRYGMVGDKSTSQIIHNIESTDQIRRSVENNGNETRNNSNIPQAGDGTGAGDPETNKESGKPANSVWYEYGCV